MFSLHIIADAAQEEGAPKPLAIFVRGYEAKTLPRHFLGTS